MNWEKVGARKADVQKVHQFARGAIRLAARYDLPPLENQLYHFDGRATHVYFGRADLNAFMQAMRTKLQDEVFLRSFPRDLERDLATYLQRGEAIVWDLASDSSALFEQHRQFENLWDLCYEYNWVLFFLAPIETMMREELAGLGRTPGETDAMLAVVAHPERETPLMAAERSTLELARLMRTDQRAASAMAADLARRFGWMSVYNFDDEARTAAYYENEAEKLLTAGTDPSKNLERLAQDRREHQREYEKLFSEIHDEPLRSQVSFAHIAGYLRDKREEIRDRLTMLHRHVYERLAEGVVWELAEIINLTTSEIHELIRDPPAAGLRERARRRLHAYLLVVQQGTIGVFGDPEEITRLAPREETQMDAFSGQAAFAGAGPVRGKVRIIMSNREIPSFREGEILVTSMTKPDYIGAMKSAVAIVTDEGGITSHAAIVARELKKPCIIGTKIATQVLKDGDEIEVDADKGIVRVLKRSA